MTGEAVQAPDAATAKAKQGTANDVFVAELTGMNAMAPGCRDKNDANKAAGPGATRFAIMGSYQISNGDYDTLNPNNLPLTCKTGGPECWYQPKKPGASD